MIFDVIVVGGGMSGVCAAHTLAMSGRTVAICEQGYDFRKSPMPKARSQHIQSRSSRCSKGYSEFFADDADSSNKVVLDQFSWIRGRQIGGRGITWSGSCPRFSDEDLQYWPITLSDLHPHYATAEELLEACELPLATFCDEIEVLKRIFWDTLGFPKLEGQKQSPFLGDSIGTTLERLPILKRLHEAEGTGLIKVLDRCKVRLIEIDEESRTPSGVIAEDLKSGQNVRLRSRSVILCSSTISTTEILLNTASRYPAIGAGINSPFLGVGLQDHTPTVQVSGITAATSSEQSLSDHALFYVPSTSKNRYWIQGELEPIIYEGSLRSKLSLFSFGEVPSRAENSVFLSGGSIGASLVVSYKGSVELKKTQGKIEACLLSAAQRAGYVNLKVQRKSEAGLAIHESGTARMGSNPENSVVDSNSLVWGLRNLYLADASVFPSSGASSPTLTIVALAIRVCRHLHEALKK